MDGGFRVTGSSDQAVFASGGSIDIYNAIVEDNQSAGVWAMSGGSIDIIGSNTHIRGNIDGVVAWASSVGIREGVVIEDNEHNGISVNFGSHLFLHSGVKLALNKHHGILVSSNSTATVYDSFIQQNYGHGIEILAESYVFFGDGGNTIIDNGQWGINCNQDPPSSSQIWGNPGTVSGNPSGQINCP